MSTTIGNPPRLRYKVQHIISSTMLCCGRKKETRETLPEAVGEEGRRPRRLMPEMVVQSDFRKVSGISTEIFRQIEAVEKDFDARAAEAVERRGEMVVRLLDPASLGRVGAEACRRYLRAADSSHVVQFVEIVKRPGQTLGLYIREGDLVTHAEGVFISRIALESAVYSSGLLKVEDEILAVNLVDVRHVSLDDVVIIMSIPRRLVLTIRSRIGVRGLGGGGAPQGEPPRPPPVLVLKKTEFVDEEWAPPAQPDQVAPYYYKMAPTAWEEVMTRQPKAQPAFPGTLQQPAQLSFHTEPTDSRRIFLPPRYLLQERHQFLQGERRLLRTESEQRISSMGSDERYYSLGRPLRRSGSGITLQQRRVRRTADEMALVSRRQSSSSDTESGRTNRGRFPSAGIVSRGASWGVRSNSLPRVRMSEMDFRRFHRLLPTDSQSDSDGALSAPEQRAPRRDRARRMTSPIFTTTPETKQWLGRAPSLSAGLCAVGRPQLPRSAHSAESLLDRLKQEEARVFSRRPLLRSATDLACAARQEERLQPLNPRDFLKYRPERDQEAVLGGGVFSGLLWVHLVAGRGLRSAGDHCRDLYCVIECDRVHKARTVVRAGDHSFDWDEVFELELMEASEVAFLLYSWDPQLRHKLCYKGSLHLLSVLRESPAHALALKLEPRGTLYLKLRYRDPRQTFARTAGPSGALFGGDLEAAAANHMPPVPIIVRRCAEEVERRGLEIVGIYRLCGSAVRKKTLRDAFERNAHTVDLSADHVPDINVITSVMKDYLRELPEPLFTRGLFDMLADGLSVCLPDDPEGNAKLMFSILDCLPKVNRCTVLYIMDHLKVVSAHSERNKMGAASLAACFGPIVMCHTETGAPVADFRKPIDILAYLLDIWPHKRTLAAPGSGSSNSSGSNGVQEAAKKPIAWRPLPESSC